MRLYMVRHGQTRANEERFYYGDLDIGLTELGKEQARSIRPILANVKFDKVYSSDLLRAIETQRLAIPGVEGERTPLLREINEGVLGGKSYDYVYNNPDLFDGWTPVCDQRGYSVVGGESLEMVGQRIRKFLKMLEDDPCDNVAAFVHSGLLGSMLRLVLGATEFNRGAAASNNCGVHVFEYDGKRWKLLAWNYGITLD